MDLQNQTILDFVDKLIEEKGFPDLLPEVREQLKQDIMTRLDDFITARIIAALSDEDVLTFEQMLKEGKADNEMQQFVSTHVPNLTDFLTNVLLEFRGVYLGLITPPVEPSDEPPPPPPAPSEEPQNN